MPAVKGIDRKPKKRRVARAPVASVARDVPTEEPDEPELEPEPENECVWLTDLILSVVDDAVHEQRRINFRFQKYAATASACADAMPPFGGHLEAVYTSAWSQAHAELECCVLGLDSPYSSVSKKYRCDSCGASVVSCMCTVRCRCMEDVAKWSWRGGDWRFGLCRCPDRPRFRRDWERFDLRAGRSPC